jgi:outer membrane lipoprotein
MKNIIYLIAIYFLIGCASQPPAAISRIPATKASVDEVRADIKRFTGTEVRWGGEITQVENKADHTWIEVVSRELGKNGRPKANSHSGGRFIASFKGFADPVVYQVGQQLTVLGTIEGQSIRTIGEYGYAFPVVSVTGSYLWPVIVESMEHDYPPWWYYDPWPYYPWPYYPHYYR